MSIYWSSPNVIKALRSASKVTNENFLYKLMKYSFPECELKPNQIERLYPESRLHWRSLRAQSLAARAYFGQCNVDELAQHIRESFEIFGADQRRLAQILEMTARGKLVDFRILNNTKLNRRIGVEIPELDFSDALEPEVRNFPTPPEYENMVRPELRNFLTAVIRYNRLI